MFEYVKNREGGKEGSYESSSYEVVVVVGYFTRRVYNIECVSWFLPVGQSQLV